MMRVSHNPSLVAACTGGSPVGGVSLDARTTIGPASYAGGGFAVDLSAQYAAIYAVIPARAYAPGGAADLRHFMVHETGTDTFQNRRFRLLCVRGATPTGTVGAPATTTTANAITATGTASSVTCTAIGGSMNLVQASGAAKATVVTGVSAPSFTGTPAAVAFAEAPAGTNLSGVTIQYLVLGVRA